MDNRQKKMRIEFNEGEIEFSGKIPKFREKRVRKHLCACDRGRVCKEQLRAWDELRSYLSKIRLLYHEKLECGR